MSTVPWADLIVEFIYNGAQYMLGYMIGTGTLTNPTPTAWIVGGLTGLIGAANHYRALRKVPQ